VRFAVNVWHLKWNQKASPSPSSVSLVKLPLVSYHFLIFVCETTLLFIGGFSFEPIALWGLPYFLSDVFVLSPLNFCGCLFHHRRSLFGAPCVLVVASFSIRDLCFEPLALWGLHLFHQRSLFWVPCILRLPLFSSTVFVLSPLHFGAYLIFHRRSLF
jgi:hypothetical protein